MRVRIAIPAMLLFLLVGGLLFLEGSGVEVPMQQVPRQVESGEELGLLSSTPSHSRKDAPTESGFSAGNLIAEWEEIKALLLDRKTRTLGIVLALETPGFPAFFLGVIPEELESIPELANPMGHLMASILDAWEQIPGEDQATFGRFLTELFAGAQEHVAICNVGARAWKERRILAPEDLALVTDTRPAQFGKEEPAWQEDFFLRTLEDALRANMEMGETRIVERFLEDPAAQVRAVALKVLLDGKASADWATWMAFIEGLGGEEIVPLAEWVAETQDPAQAASILIMFAATEKGNLGFLIAWSKLGLRDLGVLEGTLYLEFDKMMPGQVGAAPAGFVDIPIVGDLQAMQMEGAMRQLVLDAYFSASFARGQPMDMELLTWMARLDQNPRTRAQAWRTLGRSGGTEGMEMARSLLKDPEYAASLRGPGEVDDARIAQHIIQYFVTELDAGERSLLLEESRGLELSEQDWEKLEGVLRGG